MPLLNKHLTKPMAMEMISYKLLIRTGKSSVILPRSYFRLIYIPAGLQSKLLYRCALNYQYSEEML